MAVGTTLTIYPEAEMTHQDFAITLERVSKIKSGIVSGCSVSVNGTNSLVVSHGWLIVRGRIIRVNDGSLTVPLISSGTKSSYLAATVDLSNSDAPSVISILDTVPADDADFNENNGRAYLVIANLTITPTSVTAVQPTTPGGVLSTTLLAANWTNGRYAINDSRITTTSDQQFLPAVGITSEQLSALQGANIQDDGQGTGVAYLKAFGSVPSINIPIRVIFEGE